MRPARARDGGGATRPFRRDEYASARTVSGVTLEELQRDPFHPKIGGERAVDCRCGHADIAEHNGAVAALLAARRACVL